MDRTSNDEWEEQSHETLSILLLLLSLLDLLSYAELPSERYSYRQQPKFLWAKDG